MKTRLFEGMEARRLVLQVLILAVPALVLLSVCLWVYGKHQWAQQQLATLEPRYARMLGMRQQQDEIGQALQRLQGLQAQYLYSGTEAAAQTGAAAQQKLRAVMSGAGLSVSSSQVQTDAEDHGPYERVVISMNAEGDMEDVHTALGRLREIRPIIWIDELTIERNSRLENTSITTAPGISVQLVASILKSKGRQPDAPA